MGCVKHFTILSISKSLLLLSLCLLIISCGEGDQRENEIAKIPVEVEVSRFDERFAEATADSLSVLKEEFPYLFPREYPDEVWVEKMTDTIQLEINREVAQEFSDFSEEKEALQQLFQHIKYYFPQTEIPQVVTLTSDVDYRNKVVWTEGLLLISLDTYLGGDHHFYMGIQEFLKKNFEPQQIIPDVAAAFGETIIPRPEDRTFLAHLVYYGKLLYLKEQLAPSLSEAELMGYTEEELEWAKTNEEQVWRYFVDNEILFSTNSELQTRFLFPAPFSKFQLELDSESPAKLGQYIGWQIVRRYMEKNEASLQELLPKDAQSIFKSSNYKPRK